MDLKGKKIGIAFTGSFCTYKNAMEELEKEGTALCQK